MIGRNGARDGGGGQRRGADAGFERPRKRNDRSRERRADFGRTRGAGNLEPPPGSRAMDGRMGSPSSDSTDGRSARRIPAGASVAPRAGRGSAPGIGGGLVGPVSAVHVMPVAAHPSLTRRVRSAQWRDPYDRQRTDVGRAAALAAWVGNLIPRTGKSPRRWAAFFSLRIDCYDTTARRDTRAAPLASSRWVDESPPELITTRTTSPPAACPRRTSPET